MYSGYPKLITCKSVTMHFICKNYTAVWFLNLEFVKSSTFVFKPKFINLSSHPSTHDMSVVLQANKDQEFCMQAMDFHMQISHCVQVGHGVT